MPLRSRVTRPMESEFSKDLTRPQPPRPPQGGCVCTYPPTKMLLAWKGNDLSVQASFLQTVSLDFPQLMFILLKRTMHLLDEMGLRRLAPRQNVCLHSTHQVLWDGSLLGGGIELPGPLAAWWHRFSSTPFLEPEQQRCSDKKREPLVMGLVGKVTVTLSVKSTPRTYVKKRFDPQLKGLLSYRCPT